MLDAWDELLPSEDAPAKILIGDNVVSVAVTNQQRRELAASLLDNPRSRLARDRAEGAQKSCDAAVANAQKIEIKADSDDAAVGESRDVWDRAKVTCTALWSAEDQLKRDAAEKTISENRIGAIVVALNAGDLDRVEDLLAKNPAITTLVRDDAGIVQLLRKTVGEPARALVSAGRNIAGVQRRLCRARQVFVKIRGEDKWDQFKVEVAKNIGELGGGVPSNIVRLMDAARCE